MKKYKNTLPVLSFLFALLLAVMLVFDVLETDDGNAIMDGFKAVFGGNVGSVGSFASVDVNFSILNLLAFLLPLILSIILIAQSRGKKKSLTKAIHQVMLVVAFVFTIVIMINLGQYTKGTAELFGSETSYTYEGAKLAIGAILAIVFAGLGTVTTLVEVALDVKG